MVTGVYPSHICFKEHRGYNQRGE